MDHSVRHESYEPCPCKDDVADDDGPEKLLEERWFFSNLLDRGTRMSRTSRDHPCTYSDYSQENLPGRSYEATYELIKRLSRHGESRQCKLMRAPSLPPSMERKDHNDPITKGSIDPSGRRKLNGKTSSTNLTRQPSLPISLGAEEFQDEEMEFSLGNLIRQASLSDPDTMPPRKHAAKGTAASSSISRQESTKEPELDSEKLEGLEKKRPQRLTSQLKTQKSLSALESKEFQGLRDLGFDFDNENLNPSVTSKIPGMPEKKKMEEGDQGKNMSRLYRSQSLAPPVPKGGVKRSTEEDMKAQIKFWARAVASNVR